MKKTIYIIVALALIGVVAFTLINNKKEMSEKASIADIKSEAIAVKTIQPELGRIEKSFAAQGNFVPIQSLTLLAETQGQILQVFKRRGDQVRTGQLLLQVQDNTMKADLATAEANYEKAKMDLSRFEKLSTGEAITKQQLENARIAVKTSEGQLVLARQRLNKTKVVSPINGEINQIYVEVGSYLSSTPPTKLYDIVNVNALKLNVKVGEREVLLINKGDKVKVSADINPASQYNGIVSAISAQADNSLKFEVEIEVKNSAENRLRAGMYGTAHFEISEQKEALLLPREALTGSIQNPQVFVVENNIAYLRKIKIGTVTQTQIEIIEGLTPKQEVVVSGQINLQDGTKVTSL